MVQYSEYGLEYIYIYIHEYVNMYIHVYVSIFFIQYQGDKMLDTPFWIWVKTLSFPFINVPSKYGGNQTDENCKSNCGYLKS